MSRSAALSIAASTVAAMRAGSTENRMAGSSGSGAGLCNGPRTDGWCIASILGFAGGLAWLSIVGEQTFDG